MCCCHDECRCGTDYDIDRGGLPVWVFWALFGYFILIGMWRPWAFIIPIVILTVIAGFWLAKTSHEEYLAREAREIRLRTNAELEYEKEEEDAGLIYYGYTTGKAWAFKTPEELGAWAAKHPEGTIDVAVAE